MNRKAISGACAAALALLTLAAPLSESDFLAQGGGRVAYAEGDDSGTTENKKNLSEVVTVSIVKSEDDSEISGEVATGTTLKVKVETTQGNDDADVSNLFYQWYAGEEEIKDATSSTYTIADGDAGKSITVKVTATDANTTATGDVTSTAVTVANAEENTHTPSTTWTSDSTGHWHACTDEDCTEKLDFAAHISDGGKVTTQPTTTTEGVRTYSCTVCGYVIKTEKIDKLTPEHEHSYGTAWESDESGHWHVCECGEKSEVIAHTSDDGVVVTEPTETSTGLKVWSCTERGYVIKTETIEKLSPEHEHSYNTAWSTNANGHWHECECGDTADYAAHTSNGGIVTVAPTTYSTGLRVYSCIVCGYELDRETIPMLYYPSYPSYSIPSTTPVLPPVSVPSGSTGSGSTVTYPQLTAETASVGSSSTISWTTVEGASGYSIYRYTNGKYVKIKTTTNTSVTFNGLKNGKTYRFLIRYNMNGKVSSLSHSVKVTVTAYYKPIVKTQVSGNSVKFAWKAVDGAEKYGVYKYSDGKLKKLYETEKTKTKINGLSSDTEYSYVVRAYVDGEWTTVTTSDIVTVTID